MQSLRPVEPLPFTAFRHTYGSSSDPLKFSLHRSVSDSFCAYVSQNPYPSPPMPGSPSLRGHSSPCQQSKRKRSESPTTASKLSVKYDSYTSKPQGISSSSVSERSLYTGTPATSLLSVNSATPGPPQLLPALTAVAPIPPRPAALPPRSTRRAKAHVASACVNCKRKHLGCDSARPCRRCVVAGKESSCVDVTHKRRGRPPLKAEEGPIRGYEPGFNQPSNLPHSHQSTAPDGHGRGSLSREIRPNTEFRNPPPAHTNGDQIMRASPPAHIATRQWGTSMLPSPSATVPPSSPLSTVLIQSPLSRESGPFSVDRHTSVSSPVLRAPVPPRSSDDGSNLSLLSRDQFPPPRSPRQYKSIISTPLSSAPGQTQYGANSVIRLPPIPPLLTKLKVDFSFDSQVRSNTSSPWSVRGEPRNEKSHDIHQYPISPLTREENGWIERRWSHEQALVSPSYSLPPLRQPSEPLQRQRCFSTSAVATGGSRDITSMSVNEGVLMCKETQPVKRRKMELGEMVNG
ncbi:hypothetical protein LOZ39_001138 [Ophidiomyces ophidiicola]|uniref:uncharacterized protein n=1 Tax=Ophidiomyces ophidiicola TaxID=1387563 RepID=UPI0020C23D74|nr:uncharacterized protein LOZ57_002058 [Ophidiomyces ophidiicola]KAI1915526.1 hypothetical protein LOZ64_003555 [Ophidiomyces ophidiicola]KAI1950499.1 hypothetical protein LOZ57_002058 [Ophidiomyces ophidiicola]KAI2008662.1 hypothetical protein LOZ50_001879 [Ophidiomyces ophidiicola]KAI2014675.1 hypothetical protein LOZ49_001208 [Ophidiomyces ophidiicola]KAI2017158.1 hypothetical protein LOZ46_004627 [Ophidiomyces ophidiicola]